MKFKEAVERTPHLEKAYKVGLQALRREDKPHIDPENPRNLTGSVDVDKALQKVDPNGNRWDFAISYKHTNRSEEFIYWTELHTASDSEVKVVMKKARWLRQWLNGDGRSLAAFEREINWVSSGATTFTLTSPQVKQMATVGLRHVGNRLHIRNNR